MTADAHPARPPRAPSRRSLLQAGSLVLLLGTQQIARGEYLALVGNCMTCHTTRGGLPYAGGRGIATPFGTVYAGNLTPATLPIGNTAAAVTSIVYSGTGAGKYGPFMPLAAGDAGIRSVQQFNLSASYVSGVLNLMLCKPLTVGAINAAQIGAKRRLCAIC